MNKTPPGSRRSQWTLAAPVRLAPRDLLALGLLGVRTRKARAALSALGIAIGIATMIVVAGIPASSQQALMRKLPALGTNTLQAQAMPDSAQPVTLPVDAPAMVQRIGPVTGVSAVANTHVSVHRTDRVDADDYSGLTVLAARPGLLHVVNATMSHGRFLDASDVRFPTAVLGPVAASRLGITTLPPGGPSPQIDVAGQWFTVVGLMAPTPLTPDLDRSVFVGWQAAQSRLHFDGHPTVIYLTAREDAIEAVQAVLPATVYPQLPGMVQVSRPSDALAAKRDTQATFSALFMGLAGVALLVGGIGVANTMVVSVLERRREIGLRRALGAARGQIRAQFLTESVVLSALGGGIGTLVGVAVTVGYARWQQWPPTVPVPAAAGGFGAALVIGMAAGLYPSMRAARLPPTEALAAD
jgi:putative ABC transport system permease protein